MQASPPVEKKVPRRRFLLLVCQIVIKKSKLCPWQKYFLKTVTTMVTMFNLNLKIIVIIVTTRAICYL